MAGISHLEEAVTVLEKTVNELEPELLHPGDLERLVELFAKAANVVAAGQTALAARVADTQVWRRRGARSPEAYVASVAGTSFGRGRALIETGRRLALQPEVRTAFTEGSLSFDKAKEITEAIEMAPEAESQLVAKARTGTYKEVIEATKAVKAAAELDPLDAYERVRRARFHRAFVDRDGMYRGEYALAPKEGAEFKALVGRETRRLLQQAVKDGSGLTPDQASADALSHLVTGKAQARGVTTQVIFRADLAAYRRGKVESGEVCEIKGVGPVPVEVVREVMADAFVAAVISDGSDLKVAKTFGRHLKADVKAALEWRYDVCGIEGCDVSWGLEHHHWDTDYVESKITGFSEVCPLCSEHHDLVTYRGYRLAGDPGSFRLVPPDDDPDGEGRGPP